MTKLKKCNTCSNEIATNAKFCPKCGAKNKKPIYKRWWFISIAVFVLIIATGGNRMEKWEKENMIVHFDYDEVYNHFEQYQGKFANTDLLVIQELRNDKTGYRRYAMATETNPTRYIDMYVKEEKPVLQSGDEIHTSFELKEKEVVDNINMISSDLVTFNIKQ